MSDAIEDVLGPLPKGSEAIRAIEDAILSRARQLRIADGAL